MTIRVSTRKQLLSAATRLLDAEGPAAVTVRTVGDAVGVSHTAMYRHFKDKGGLLEAVADETFQEMEAAFAGAAEKGASPLEALALVLREYFEFARRYPARYRLQFGDVSGRERESTASETTRLTETLAKFAQAAQRSGELEQVDLEQITALIGAAVHGLADLELSRQTRSQADASASLALLLDLLSEKAARARPS